MVGRATPWTFTDALELVYVSADVRAYGVKPRPGLCACQGCGHNRFGGLRDSVFVGYGEAFQRL
jgi:hypothetical protein